MTRRELFGRAAPLALAALLVVFVVTAVLFWRGLQNAEATSDRHAEVLAAARGEVLAFTTTDYRHIVRDTERILDGATGKFKKQFQQTLKQTRTWSRQGKAVHKGEVLSAGIVESDADSARVILAVDARVSNVSTRTPQPRHYRIQVDLVEQDGRWLTADLQFVG